jgi:hypothetical protein
MQPHPAVIELFQSQGCSSCPPANAVLNGLADREDLITLSFSVTYWDYLGWKDRFAQKAFTDRQYDYAHAAGRANVATPQMVVNGHGFLTGQSAQELDRALKTYARTAAEPDIALSGNVIMLSAGDFRGTATVWLVRYEPGMLNVPISAGENNGRTLPHRHIVRQLVALGQWRGKAASYPLPAAVSGLKTAILVQSGRAGPILTAKAL